MGVCTFGTETRMKPEWRSGKTVQDNEREN